MTVKSRLRKKDLSPLLKLSEAQADPNLRTLFQIAHYAHNGFIGIDLENDSVRAAIIAGAEYIQRDQERRSRLGRPRSADAKPESIARRERRERSGK